MKKSIKKVATIDTFFGLDFRERITNQNIGSKNNKILKAKTEKYFYQKHNYIFLQIVKHFSW